MIALTARTFLRQKQEARNRARPLSRFVHQVQVSAPPPAPTAAPTPIGPTPRPTPRDPEQASLFGRIFKEDVGGVSTLPQAQRDDLYRRGIFVWDGISPELRRWFDKWRRGGGIAFL